MDASVVDAAASAGEREWMGFVTAGEAIEEAGVALSRRRAARATAEHQADVSAATSSFVAREDVSSRRR